MLKQLLSAGVALLLSTAGLHAGLTAANFNFEGQATTNSGGLQSLSLTNNGLTITIDRVGQPFDVVNLSSYAGSVAFGSRSLAPTPPGSNFFNVNFSSPVSSFSADMGDFGVSKSDSLALTAFTGANGTGTNLGTTSASLPLTSISSLSFKTVSFTGAGIESVELSGGTTAAANSVYYDNFNATFNSSGSGGNSGGGGNAVPLPPASYVMPFGLAMAWLASRKLRRA
ncbi:MAG TPA: hypothetical protein VFE47_21500 [Tepidisphaeraceae bacterium]|jgi:hypothetical protein|nr:hypothetical protein [Tepidisphaeraceae bacterium]